MIEMTWGQIREPGFQRALGKLMNTDKLEFKHAYHISRLGAKIQSEAKEAQDWFVKLVKKYAEVDEKSGEFKVKDEHVETWQKEMSDFTFKKFGIDRHKIHVSDLKVVGLTPNEILALEPLLFGLELVEGEEHGKEEKNH